MHLTVTAGAAKSTRTEISGIITFNLTIPVCFLGRTESQRYLLNHKTDDNMSHDSVIFIILSTSIDHAYMSSNKLNHIHDIQYIVKPLLFKPQLKLN